MQCEWLNRHLEMYMQMKYLNGIIKKNIIYRHSSGFCKENSTLALRFIFLWLAPKLCWQNTQQSLDSKKAWRFVPFPPRVRASQSPATVKEPNGQRHQLLNAQRVAGRRGTGDSLHIPKQQGHSEKLGVCQNLCLWAYERCLAKTADACGFPPGLQTLTSLLTKRKHKTKCLTQNKQAARAAGISAIPAEPRFTDCACKLQTHVGPRQNLFKEVKKSTQQQRLKPGSYTVSTKAEFCVDFKSSLIKTVLSEQQEVWEHHTFSLQTTSHRVGSLWLRR